MGKHIQSLLWDKPLKVFKDIFKDLGAELPDDEFLSPDIAYLWPDRFLQMCPPSTQYTRSDAPKTFRFTGGLPKLPRIESSKPSWWHEVVDNPTKKDIVLISQGTVELNYDNLIIPALEAMKDRPNTLVIVVLGIKGATLDPSVPIAENVRVVDYLPFDEILPHCSVFVHNGGYGGVQHSIKHGTPLVVAGQTEDKPEMCAIAEWAGVAVNLKTGKPTKEALRIGIDEVVSNPKYKNACQRIQAEIATFDPMRVIKESIEEVLAEGSNDRNLQDKTGTTPKIPEFR
jgi:UDP:flavonoid glycosyltransferase YjiC (YdhE family)